IPLAVLNKPERLLDEEMAVMKMHTLYGYDLLKNVPGISKQVLAGVVQHHERLDGTGYPFGLAAEKIEPFGRIIAVADIYDALTSDRVYHKKTTPFAVVELLIEEMFGALDPTVCTVFLNNVRDYFLGNRVLLNTGEQAEVVYLGQFLGSRPIVKTEDGDFVDLERRKEVTIVKLVRA
ncbi:MAG: HD domain-containing phosphohydrolase, partial [Sporomusaceae bacterium]|nr:HD domain-containing phosphohydrolase [Sporomusaceae bacterium]